MYGVQPRSVNEVTPLPTALSGTVRGLCSSDHGLIFDRDDSLNLLQTAIPSVHPTRSLRLLVAGRTARGNRPEVPRVTSYRDYNCMIR